MALRDFFRRLFAFDPPPGAERVFDSDAPPPPAAAAPPPAADLARPTERARDPLAGLAAMPDVDAVDEAVRRLDVEADRTASLALLRWLRETSTRATLPARARVKLADWFVARGESASAEPLLASVALGDPAHAAPAMMRLGELSAQRGDAAGAARWFELVMGVDLEFPGARERRARYDRPVRAGDAGATLLAPDARAGVGRYALLRELGRGGAGAVFLASDARLDRQVALKLYHPQARADRGARLRGEAQVAAAVASAHVVRVHALHESLGAIVMEYFPGGSLRARVTQGSVTAGEARRWAHEVALGLAHIHAAGWVHRDLKPGNVLLRADGRAVLTDFGLARAVGHASRAMEGTAGYVAPEAQGPSAASPSHDVYAFGVMARELGLDRDERLGALVERCVSIDPSRRPRDGVELASLTR